MNTSSERFNVPTRPRISAVCVVVWLVIPALNACLLLWAYFSIFGGN